MKHLFLLIMVALFVLAVAACGDSGAPKNPHSGDPMAQGSCVSCHGPG